MKVNSPLLLTVILCGMLTAAPAYAYVDPNATGLISQIAGPVLVVAATGAAFLRKQISSAIRWLVGRVNGR
jgi:type IV secretory pathway TrbL component